MAITKVTRNMLTTGIVDNSNATAITIDSSENVTLSGDLTIAKATSGADSTFKVASTAASGENDATVIINSGGTGDAMLRFDYESSTDRARIGVTTSAQALQFFTAGANERMRITSAGLIGMGDSPNNLTSEIVTITTPASGGGQGIAFKRLDTNTDQVCGQIRWSNNATDDLAFIKVKTDGANASSAMQFFTNTGSGIAERMRIDSAGRLCVNTTSPINLAHTFQTTNAGNNVAVFNNTVTSGNPYGIQLRYSGQGSGTGGDAYTYYTNSSGSFVLGFAVRATGNVVNVNNSYGQISDRKLKENIVDATNKLDELKQIKIRNFNFIGDDTKQIGVVAQELETIFPALITDTEDVDVDGNNAGTTTKEVKYSVLLPIAIKAIQELTTKLEAAEARITTLEG